MKNKFLSICSLCGLTGVLLSGCGNKQTQVSEDVDWNSRAGGAVEASATSDSATSADVGNSDTVTDAVDETGLENEDDVVSAVDVLNTYVSSEEFLNASDQRSSLDEKLYSLVNEGLIMDGYSFNSVAGGFDFATRGGELYTVTSEGVSDR